MTRRDPSRCLRFRWSKAERDFLAFFPARKADANMLLHTFVTLRNLEGRTFIEELEFRGFDAKRILFSVPLKEKP